MTLDANYSNAANSIKNGNLSAHTFTGTAGIKIDSKSYNTEEETWKTSAVATFNIFGNNFSSGFNADIYEAIDNAEDLMEFFGANGADWDNYAVSTNTLDDGTIQCFNADGDVIYEYRNSDIGEAYRVNYDTNGDGVVDENDNDAPTYNKAAQNDAGNVLIYETKYDEASGKYVKCAYDA